MTALIANPLIPRPVALDKDFVSRQILEISNMAREQGKLEVALEGLGMIAEIQGMLSDPA